MEFKENHSSQSIFNRLRNMLDGLYKTAVVSITNHYVEKQADVPAAAVAKDVFEAMHKKGWHNARLVDATGKPKNKDNLPQNEAL